MNALFPPPGAEGGEASVAARAWPEAGRTFRFLRRLAALHGVAVLAVAATWAFRAIPAVSAAWADGLAGVVLAALLLPLTALVATIPLCRARALFGVPAPQPALVTGRLPWLRRISGRVSGRILRPPAVQARPRHGSLSRLARRPQGVIVPLGAGLAVAALWCLPPLPAAPALALEAAAGLIALTFPFLVAERMMATVPESRLLEAAELRALLLLPVLCVPAAGLLHAAAGAGQAWAQPAMAVLAVFLALVSAELAVRALANWFLPPPPPEVARAAVASLSVLVLQPGRAAKARLGDTLRTGLGLDFSRSWALRYVRSAAVPVLLVLVLFAWVLSGVSLVGLDRRGIYERFGAPVAVWQPGLHLGLPWPLGRVRTVELGLVHAASLGDAGPPGPPPSAEDPAPAGADRLWDAAHPAEVSFLIAAADAAGAQSFQSISVDMTVLFRTGLDDASALRAAYAVVSPEAAVRAEAGRLLARFFARQTLADVLGGDRERLAGDLRAALQAALDRLSAGTEIVAVVIDAVHPPAGAADAFHDVQAAEIVATTAIFAERGRAQAAASLAAQMTAEALNTANGAAADVVGAAQGMDRVFTADRAAAATGSEAFLLERYLSSLSAALPRSPLVILDHRLGGASAPVIDLRPTGVAKPTGDDD